MDGAPAFRVWAPAPPPPWHTEQGQRPRVALRNAVFVCQGSEYQDPFALALRAWIEGELVELDELPAMTVPRERVWLDKPQLDPWRYVTVRHGGRVVEADYGPQVVRADYVLFDDGGQIWAMGAE